MAIKTSTHSPTVGKSALDTSTTLTNPITAGPAKAQQGQTQKQADGLQVLSFDAHAVDIAEAILEKLKSRNAPAGAIKVAEADLADARATYEADLGRSADTYGLTSAAINQALTGGTHPVPDNALIPASDADLATFAAGLKNGDLSQTEAAADKSSPVNTDKNNPVNTDKSGVVNVDKSLTAAQQQHLSDSSKVLSTANIPGVTSGDLSGSFTLYPSGAPNVDDVNQKVSEDCYWMSALASMAATPEGRKKVQDAIKGPQANGDYIVTLYAPSGTPVDIAVNPKNLPVGADGKAAFNNGANGSSGANWVNLMEAAYAKYNDVYQTNTVSAENGTTGYDGIMRTGVDDVSFNYALTGKRSKILDVKHATPATLTKTVSDALAAGQPVEVYNYDKADSVDRQGNTIIGGHAYTVMGISADGKTVTLRNPWGANDNSKTSKNGTFTMTMDDFKLQFEQANA